jgi:hypothetical protein
MVRAAIFLGVRTGFSCSGATPAARAARLQYFQERRRAHAGNEGARHGEKPRSPIITNVHRPQIGNPITKLQSFPLSKEDLEILLSVCHRPFLAPLKAVYLHPKPKAIAAEVLK